MFTFLFGSPLERISKRKEVALGVFHKILNELESLKGYVNAAIDDTDFAIEETETQLRRQMSERGDLHNEMAEVQSSIQKVEAFLG